MPGPLKERKSTVLHLQPPRLIGTVNALPCISRCAARRFTSESSREEVYSVKTAPGPEEQHQEKSITTSLLRCGRSIWLAWHVAEEQRHVPCLCRPKLEKILLVVHKRSVGGEA